MLFAGEKYIQNYLKLQNAVDKILKMDYNIILIYYAYCGGILFMIKSMTAFGRSKQTVGGKDITVEIKSVNNSFFDCSTKLPRAFSFLE